VTDIGEERRQSPRDFTRVACGSRFVGALLCFFKVDLYVISLYSALITGA
jgi:hypothetical protein